MKGEPEEIQDSVLAVLSAVMLSEDERKAKEAALAGLTGGSFSEIVLLLLVIPVRKSQDLMSRRQLLFASLLHSNPSIPLLVCYVAV